MTEPLMTTSLSMPDFSDMTKAGLLSYAEEHGVEGVSGSMRKTEIQDAILAKLTEAV